jgi:hypothetical protein
MTMHRGWGRCRVCVLVPTGIQRSRDSVSQLENGPCLFIRATRDPSALDNDVHRHYRGRTDTKALP